jgi:UDP-N-acetylmuramoylalanine--D-glutamate ligase
MDFKSLRRKHPRLIYQGFAMCKEKNDLLLTFDLLLEPDIHFSPKLIIRNLDPKILEQIDSKKNLDPQLNQLFFQLGIAEIPSYFKTSCPKEILIKHQGQISKTALPFWQDLLINGLGEFYYQNQIDFTAKDFVKIKLEKLAQTADDINYKEKNKFTPVKHSSVLVPVGGGKDSATVLAMLEEKKLAYDVLLLSPNSPAAKKIALILQKNGHCQNIIEVERQIDPQLIELNKKGYLNGHTPFSAYLAFLSSAVAYLYGQSSILLGNEASSEEENLLYLGHKINHQYSKSLDFEEKFAKYSQTQLFLTEKAKKSPKYLSLLRELSEIEITKILCDFAAKDQRFAEILTTFKSCNVGQKQGIWCHNCPKCAFVYTMLSAYLDEEFVAEKIFSENLFNKKSLEQTFLDLAGFGDKKPFECVGTFAEVRQALLLAEAKSKNPSPFLKEISQKIAKQKLLDNLANKSILILGMGREGSSTLNFLRQRFPNKKLAVADEKNRTLPKDANLISYFGKDYLKKIAQYEIIVKTAGIPLSTPEIQNAIKKGSEILSNTQIFFTLCKGKIIGITGTKGKSTTSKLTYEILQAAYPNTVFVGNIGEAPLNQLNKIDQDTLVVDELSCHQLAELKNSPHVSVVLDIKAEHLDYYPNFETYFQAKTAIARYQKENDYLIYNKSLVGSSRMATLSRAQKLTHNLDGEDQQASVYLKNEQIFYQNEAIIKVEEIPLIGRHNLYNVMPAILVGKLFKVKNSLIKKVIQNFHGLAHRLELVAEIDGVKYFNDSISTNPHSAIMAIKSFAKGSVILIAGGYERNQDFSELADVMADYQVKYLIALPSTGQRLIKFALQKGEIAHDYVESMRGAVLLAKQKAEANDIVLLSPASASFGKFANYEERGEAFRQIVLESQK